MIYKFIINNRLPSLNDYIDQCRFNKYSAASFKRKIDNLIINEIRSQLAGVHITKPVVVYMHFLEENKRRDVDNIYSASKYILDALVKTNVLENDNPKHVIDVKYSHDYGDESRIVVAIQEIEIEE